MISSCCDDLWRTIVKPPSADCCPNSHYYKVSVLSFHGSRFEQECCVCACIAAVNECCTPVGLTGVSQMPVFGRREMSVGWFDVVKEAVRLVYERVAEHVLLLLLAYNEKRHSPAEISTSLMTIAFHAIVTP